ncbi:protein kinase [Actinoplanes sp. NPDC051343]|uniref:serine/threonine-protein kinase n=1 Tax=Actinoplanes sp. NPDC051343 TaxID=3363906 RepID=UPI00378846BA
MQSSPSRPGSTSAEAATADLSGRCVGNSYILIAPVGQGATGTVWRAIERSSGVYVAVKLLHDSLLRQPKLVTRFVRERTILMMMRHDNIVGVRDLFSVGESLALVMDFVAGGTLRDRLIASGTVPPSEAAQLLAQVAAALTQAHELGVVHRDVKPDNILLETQADGAGQVKLTDFGIARVLDTAGLTTPHAIMGTPHYMAPEAATGVVDPAADVYAVGVVLYELVSGHTPYSGEPLAVLRRHVESEPERPSGMPDAVWDMIAWCLDKDPRRRPSAGELAIALRDLSRQTAGEPALPVAERMTALSAKAPAHPSVRREPARRRPRNGPRSWVWRRPGMMVALIAGLMAVSGVGGVKLWRVLDSTPARGAVQSTGPMIHLPAQERLASPGASASPGPSSAAAPPVLVAGTPTEGLPPAGAFEAPAASGAVTAGPAHAAVTVGPGTAGGSVEFGPWRCGDDYTWDLGHPVLAKPCNSLGDAIRVMGMTEAMPGIQADFTLSVRDASSDAVVAGPFTCKGLLFTDFEMKHNCGPVDLQAPHGHRYLVAETWTYTGRSILPGGIARGPAFDW